MQLDDEQNIWLLYRSAEAEQRGRDGAGWQICISMFGQHWQSVAIIIIIITIIIRQHWQSIAIIIIILTGLAQSGSSGIISEYGGYICRFSQCPACGCQKCFHLTLLIFRDSDRPLSGDLDCKSKQTMICCTLFTRQQILKHLGKHLGNLVFTQREKPLQP